MNPLIQLKQTTSVFLIAFGLACFGLSPAARAVTPAPDGGYPGENTAEGDFRALEPHMASTTRRRLSCTFNTTIGFDVKQRHVPGAPKQPSDKALSNTAVGYKHCTSKRRPGHWLDNTAIGDGALH